MLKINGYLIDIATELTETYEAEVTEYPVERGGSINDNVDNRGVSLSVKFKVSDTPTGDIAKARSANAVPSSEARSYLLALRASREPFTVEAVGRIWDNLVFESLEFPVDDTTGAALDGSATLREVRIADVVRTVVSDAPAKRSLGKKQGFVVTTPNVYYIGPGIPSGDPHFGDEVYYVSEEGAWFFGDGDFPNPKYDQQLTAEQVENLRVSHAKFGVRNIPGTDTYVTTVTSSLPTEAGGDAIDVGGSYVPMRDRITSSPYRNGYLNMPVPAADVTNVPSSLPVATPTGPIGITGADRF